MVNINYRAIYALNYVNKLITRGLNVQCRPRYELPPNLPSIDFEVHGKNKVQLYVVIDFHGKRPYYETWKAMKSLRLAKKQKLKTGEKREVEAVVRIMNPTFGSVDELVERLEEEERFEHSHLAD